jgi:hypothetical protein
MSEMGNGDTGEAPAEEKIQLDWSRMPQTASLVQNTSGDTGQLLASLGVDLSSGTGDDASQTA